MEAAGQNWTRVWMTDFYITRDRVVVQRTGPGSTTGSGQYGDVPAFRVEQILDLAEQYGLEVQLVLNDHGQFSSHVNARWAENPYNADNGGPVPADRPGRVLQRPDREAAVQAAAPLPRRPLRRLSRHPGLGAVQRDPVHRVRGEEPVQQRPGPRRPRRLARGDGRVPALARPVRPPDHDELGHRYERGKAIWADPNIDLVQVHDYGPLSGRDERFRGYAENLNADLRQARDHR